MEVVKKFEFPASTFGQSTHDWKAILSAEVAPDQLGKPGKAVKLVEGEDFDSKPEQFCSMIRNQAAKKHLKAKASIVRTEGKPTNIFVQVCKMTDEEAADADAKIEAQKEKGKERRLAKKAGGESTAEAPAAE